MGRLYEYTENTNLFQLTIGLNHLFAEVLSLKESFSWNDYAKSQNLKEEKLTSSIEKLHDDAKAYKLMLQSFIENSNYFEDTSCVDKFMSGEITAVRKRAISSLSVLELKARSSIDRHDGELLMIVVSDLRESTNFYLAIVRDILRYNRKLQTILLTRGIDYRVKYDLSDI